MTAALPANSPRPISAWQAKEKAFYQALLAKGRFDVLVVPFQVQDYALDRATRSFMTAQLAAAIATEQHSRIPDPYLVARALGEGERRLKPEEVYQFAKQLGVSRIVWGYVGHDQHYRMNLVIQQEDRPAEGFQAGAPVLQQKDFPDIAFCDENPPIEVFQTLLPEVLKALGLSATSVTAPKPESRLTADALPASPIGMVPKQVEPARDAYYLQLMAALTPIRADRTRERLAEKSLLAVYSMSPTSAEYRALKARAFLQLGMRPAALRLLGTPETVEEKELFAALNGNQPDVANLSGQISNAIKTLLAKSDENSISAAYGLRNPEKLAEAARTLNLPGKVWPFFAARAFTDTDGWAQHRNIGLKVLLDQEFPVPDFTAEGLVRGAATIGDEKKLDAAADLSVISHIHKLQQSEPEKWCCQNVSAYFTGKDYLDFVEGVATDNLVRRAIFFSMTQGLPERSLEYLDSVMGEYRDHPQFTTARAEAEIRKAQTLDMEAKEALLRTALAELTNAAYWEQGQTPMSTMAAALAESLREQGYSSEYHFDNLFVADYPFRSFYLTWDRTGYLPTPEYIKARAMAALANSAWEFSAAADAYELSTLQNSLMNVDEVMNAISSRFIGAPQRWALLAENSLKKGDLPTAEGYLRQSIQSQPEQWRAYMNLGTLLLEDGKVNEAFSVFLSYPGYKNDAGENPVGISQIAYDIGGQFYWTGDFSQATAMYKIASQTNSGSDGDMGASARLKLISGDYPGAMEVTLLRAQRYNNAYAFSDYLGYLHAIGHSQESWDAFSALLGRWQTQAIWESALVGHRIARAGEADIASWTKQDQRRNDGGEHVYAANYLLRSSVTDRTPSEDLPSRIAEIERPVQRQGLVLVRSASGSTPGVIIRSFPPNTPMAMEPRAVKSDLVAFAEGYRAMRKGDFGTARAVLEEAANTFDVTQNEFGYLLSYYAFAAAQTGDVSNVEMLLNSFSQTNQRFDYHLSKAVITGIAGKIDESTLHLKLALYRRPYTENRPLYVEHQYAELCEWLYEATGNNQFRNLALDWAKKNQILRPWYAWPYAMEAKLATNTRDRRRAAAMAYYLDPQSERLATLSKSQIDSAVKEFGKSNPFIQKKGQRNAHSA